MGIENKISLNFKNRNTIQNKISQYEEIMSRFQLNRKFKETVAYFTAEAAYVSIYLI